MDAESAITGLAAKMAIKNGGKRSFMFFSRVKNKFIYEQLLVMRSSPNIVDEGTFVFWLFVGRVRSYVRPGHILLSRYLTNALNNFEKTEGNIQ